MLLNLKKNLENKTRNFFFKKIVGKYKDRKHIEKRDKKNKHVLQTRLISAIMSLPCIQGVGLVEHGIPFVLLKL